MHRAVGKLPSYVYSCCAPPELMHRHSRTIAMAATRAPRQAALVSRATSLLPYAAVPVARGFSSGERGGGEAVKGMVVSAEAAAAAIDDATWASPRQMPAGAREHGADTLAVLERRALLESRQLPGEGSGHWGRVRSRPSW
eukprot:2164681-Pleurochrysis_carterae.AAC.2